MSQLKADEVHRLLTMREGLALSRSIVDDVAATQALVSDHFSLHDGRHTSFALRFRAFARDAAALEHAAVTLVGDAPWRDGDFTIVTPDTAGFLLGDAIRRHVATRPHAVVQTDLSRRPTHRLMTGTIATRHAIIVNDVAVTGDSLDTMRQIIEGAGATVVGVLVFAAVDLAAFKDACYRMGVAASHLVTATWAAHPGGRGTCPGCRRDEPLIPIAELA